MSGRRLTRIALIALGASVLLAAGCGGGSSSSGPTRAAFIARADAICRTTHAQTNPLIAEIKSQATALFAGGAATAKRVASVVARLRDLAAGDIARIRALSRPSGDRAAVARFLTPLTTVVDAIGSAATALRSGQAIAAVSLFAEIQPTAQKVATAARAYGFKQCPQVLSALG